MSLPPATGLLDELTRICQVFSSTIVPTQIKTQNRIIIKVTRDVINRFIMDKRGDVNLAKALQAEFGRAKPPRRRGPVQRRDDERDIKAEFECIMSFALLCHNGKGSWLPVTHQEAGAFFHQHRRPLPSPAPPTVTENPIPSAPTIQQQQSRAINVPENSDLVDKSSSSASALPWHQSIDLSSTEAYLDAIPSISATPMHLDKPTFTEETEEQEDIEMESVDYSSTSASKSTTNNTQKGLAASIWNPANRNGRADSVSSNWSFETSSDTTKPTPIVTSGITKGPGLMASRWSQGC
ncbi:hypothetical protein F5Y01DRAFT_324910 [Xylaria sp. FL0043]|nr:hypothetical protein F5Y01DRAFT_324910 [Xylaria sp. FL0043]